MYFECEIGFPGSVPLLHLLGPYCFQELSEKRCGVSGGLLVERLQTGL